jgi:hypothetical protein
MGRAANRDDVTIAIDRDGRVWVAQGGPAYRGLAKMDLADIETRLYFSQLKHRAAVRAASGELMITTIRDIPKGAVATDRHFEMVVRAQGATGHPLRVGRV